MQTSPQIKKEVLGGGVTDWRHSFESTRLPHMWPGFESQRRHHMWVKFAVRSLLCSQRLSPRSPIFHSPILSGKWNHLETNGFISSWTIKCQPSFLKKTIFRRQSVKYHIVYPWILTFLTSKSLSDIIYSHHSIEIFSGVLLQYMMLIILQGIIIYFCLCKGKLYSCTDKEQ